MSNLLQCWLGPALNHLSRVWGLLVGCEQGMKEWKRERKLLHNSGSYKGYSVGALLAFRNEAEAKGLRLGV